MKTALLVLSLHAWAQVSTPPGKALPPPEPLLLPPLDAAAIQRVRDQARAVGGSKAVGVHRELAPDALKAGQWRKLPGGRMIWRWSVRSPSALGVRLWLEDVDLPAGATLWIYERTRGAVPPPQAARYEGRGPNGDGAFWSQSAFEDTIVVEYAPADGRKARRLPFRIPRLSHQFAEL